MNQPATRKRSSKHADFFRATRFLRPYWRIVTISVVCAFFVGIVQTAGLSAMLPILRVLINDDTLQGWVDRQVVGKRLDLTLAEPASSEVSTVYVDKVERDGFAARAGIKRGDELQSLAAATDPNARAVDFTSLPEGTLKTVTALPPIPRHMIVLQRIAQFYPSGRGWGTVKTIAAVFATIAVLAIVGNFIRFFQEYLSDKSAISATNDIRRHLYDHVLHIPMNFFGLQGTSDVTSRLVQDAQVLQDGFKTVLGQSVQEPIKAFFALGLALYIDWRLTLFIVAFTPIMLAVIKKFGKKMRRASRAALQKSSSMLGQIEGTLVGIRVVKAAGAERFERRRYSSIMSLLKNEQLSMARYEALSTPTMEVLMLLLVGCVLVMASYLMFVHRSLDAARFMMIMACLVALAESLRKVSKLNTVLARSNAAAARVFETLDMPVERSRRAVEKSARVNLQPIAREIVFEDVSFSYANTNAAALTDVNLRVPRGAAVAIVGRNGSGKTTLAAMLPRFFDPKSGRITIDGVDIRNATLRSLRRQIGIVTQEAVIFPGTIAENIAYGHPLASRLHESTETARQLRTEIESAAKRAFCHDFIMEKPQGYNTPLDGLGGQLSGGQRQRLNIARAVLRQSPILILDEATSQVDAESEHLIQQAIEQLMHERTTFVIAHRFSTILSADTIVVMDRGRIVGQGKHEELLASCETYQQLYERQLFIPAAGV